MPVLMNTRQLETDIKAWLNEDMPFGDVTTMHLPCTTSDIKAKLMAKEDGLLCGCQVFDMVFKAISEDITVIWQFVDGDALNSGHQIALLQGPLDKILMGERLALNLLQRMSGIASMAKTYADAVKDTSTRVVDTRKTTPGLRQLEKYAVAVGGCYNHRSSLSDAVMIKDNHIKTAGSITAAMTGIRKGLPHTMKIEVETETLEAVSEALENKVDIIMLDNMTNDMMKEAVAMNRGKAILEASGNMTLDRLASVAATGVDIISVGALTHSPSALDISLKFQ